MVGALLATERPQASDCMSLSLGFPLCQVGLMMWNCGEGEISATAKLWGHRKPAIPMSILVIIVIMKVKVLVAQLCPTLCDLMDCSPPGSSVHGIL